MRPIRDLTEMVTMPCQAVFVVGVCRYINATNSPDRIWWHWVALGMGIATLVALGRGLRTLLLLGLAWCVSRALPRRYGPSAGAAFDAWMARENPRWPDVVRAWGDPAYVGVGPVRH